MNTSSLFSQQDIAFTSFCRIFLNVTNSNNKHYTPQRQAGQKTDGTWTLLSPKRWQTRRSFNLESIVECGPRWPGLTLSNVSGGGLAGPLGVITDPCLTALPWDGDTPRSLAPNTGWRQVRARRHAADGTIHTKAGVFAAGLEALAIAVDDTIILTASANHI